MITKHSYVQFTHVAYANGFSILLMLMIRDSVSQCVKVILSYIDTEVMYHDIKIMKQLYFFVSFSLFSANYVAYKILYFINFILRKL